MTDDERVVAIAETLVRLEALRLWADQIAAEVRATLPPHLH